MNPANSEAAARLAARLAAALPSPEAHPGLLHRAMAYACEGGKRLRGQLALAVAEGVGLPDEPAEAIAVAVELIHAYSLVHDDLPAMDDDDLRRGRPTVHRAFDEATAILVGDALQALAFEVLAGEPTLDPGRKGPVIAALARAAGSQGMVGGQALDLAAERGTHSISDLAALRDLHARKTGALIRACFELPCLAADAPEELSARLCRAGEALGLAYQIQDDVLDATASSQTLGKTAGKDAAAGKKTFVSLLGLGAAKAEAAAAFAAARAALPTESAFQPLRGWLDRIARRTF